MGRDGNTTITNEITYNFSEANCLFIANIVYSADADFVIQSNASTHIASSYYSKNDLQ